MTQGHTSLIKHLALAVLLKLLVLTLLWWLFVHDLVVHTNATDVATHLGSIQGSQVPPQSQSQGARP